MAEISDLFTITQAEIRKMPKQIRDDESGQLACLTTAPGRPDLLMSFLSHGTVMPAEWMASQLAGAGARLGPATCAATPPADSRPCRLEPPPPHVACFQLPRRRRLSWCRSSYRRRREIERTGGLHVQRSSYKAILGPRTRWFRPSRGSAV
jgi:hypothetical protein